MEDVNEVIGITCFWHFINAKTWNNGAISGCNSIFFIDSGFNLNMGKDYENML